jgi:hypothetical protein
VKRLRSTRQAKPAAALSAAAAPELARLLLELAAKADADDDRIWREVERLARAGDCAAIERLAKRRQELAPGDLVAELNSRGPRAA